MAGWALLLAAACAPATEPAPPPEPGPGMLPGGPGAVPDPLPPLPPGEEPELLLLPAVDQDAWDLAEGDLASLERFGALVRVVLGIPDHTDVPDVLPPGAVAAYLMLEADRWTAVDPAALGRSAVVVWPEEWGGGRVGVPEAVSRLERLALEDLERRWLQPAPWPNFDLPLTDRGGTELPWPEGLVVVHHPLLGISPAAAAALSARPWVAVGKAALEGPWQAGDEWVGWVEWDEMVASLPEGADTLPLLLWIESGRVVRWKAGTPPEEWLEPWT